MEYMDIFNMKEFYSSHLINDILPFWVNNSIDEIYGGYYTCFDNYGTNIISMDKYTWSQGRMVWVFSKLSQMSRFSSEERTEYLRLSTLGAEFLMKNCLLENGNCTFMMSREGIPKLQRPGMEYDLSFYADCFVILGLSRHAIASGRSDSFKFAKKVYYSVLYRFENKNLKAEPYPVPKGYKMHGISMILLSIYQEMAAAMRYFKDKESMDVSRKANSCMYEIMDNFISGDYVLHEMIREDGEFVYHTLLGRYVNPGHTIEDMWFIMHQSMETDDYKIIEKAAKVIKKTLEVGWDNEYGGLLLFADCEGGIPEGEIKGIENEKMTNKILLDWSSKLWWPHSEALYSTLLAYSLTGNEEFLDLYRKVEDYTFKTFPNPDKKIGEWIQIRDRRGNPEQKVVALPVKDPFHIARNIILIIELLDRLIKKGDRLQ